MTDVEIAIRWLRDRGINMPDDEYSHATAVFRAAIELGVRSRLAGATPLHYICRSRRRLLAAPLDFFTVDRLCDKNASGDTPLHAAQDEGCLDLIPWGVFAPEDWIRHQGLLRQLDQYCDWDAIGAPRFGCRLGRLRPTREEEENGRAVLKQVLREVTAAHQRLLLE